MYTQEQILDMYFDRNQQAVSATSQMYGAKLTRFADTMVAHEDALECVNDTYIAAWNKIPPERPMRFLSWLYRVCRNIVCDRIDWNNASKRNSNMNCMLDELEECLADSNAKYEGELSDIGRCLSDFLNGLETEKRVLFVRRYWYGMAIDELADMSGRSKSSVKAMRAGRTLELFTTKRSPGSRNSGRSRNTLCWMLSSFWLRTISRAASRGDAGSCAMSSLGKSYQKSFFNILCICLSDD